MLEGDRVVAALEAEQEEGASRDELLRAAVREVEGSEAYFDWVGIYLLEGDELVLHSYVGEPTEHDRIEVGVGVCGTAVAERRDINVPDVEEVGNYLACSPDVRSEMVVLIRDGEDGIHGQLDLDSHRAEAFGDRDREQLRTVADWLAGLFG